MENSNLLYIPLGLKARNNLIFCVVFILVSVGGYNLPQQVIKEQNELVGKYATIDIYKDDYFLKSKVSDSIDDDNYLRDESITIFITIRSLAAGLSGKLKAGDIVLNVKLNNAYILTLFKAIYPSISQSSQ